MHLFFTEIYQLNREDFVNMYTWAYPLGFDSS